ncbi:MAG UNVERIFIED_CONTAM: hypothetical protein LVR18_48985 [Planctomycetaceae bacterium]|jgi:hypothetical protein
MSRRTPRGELEFGSDSFLDVVCNIVGILIILIVVVGVRVQRQPPQQEQPNTAPTPQPVAADQAQLASDAAARERSQTAALNNAASRRDELVRSQQQLQQESSQLEDDLQLAQRKQQRSSRSCLKFAVSRLSVTLPIRNACLAVRDSSPENARPFRPELPASQNHSTAPILRNAVLTQHW